jgi:hypothetical protein
MVLNNPGLTALGWEINASGIDGLTVTPSSGSLAAQGVQVLTLAFPSSVMQARAAPYDGTVTVRATSGTCKCREQEVSVSVSATVSASANANLSAVTLSASDDVSAAGNLEFTIDPIDDTGTPILDASDVIYFGFLDAVSSRRRLQTGSTTCTISYDAALKQHRGNCGMPSDGGIPIAGSFSLRVLDSDLNLVSGVATSFDVEACPESWFFHSPSGECRGCPKGATCAGGKQLPIPDKGYWSDVSNAELGRVFPCVHTANCRGGDMYEGSCWEDQEAVDACGIDLCANTAMGPRCGRCKFDDNPRSYMRDDTECEKCTGREGPAIIAATIAIPVLVIGLPLLMMRLEHTRAFAYRLYNHVFDVGRFKVIWVNYAIMCSISWNLAIDFPQPFSTLEDL